MEILHIRDLTFTYPGRSRPVLQKLSLSVKEGELLLLCGASGSGKSTLLRLLKPEISPAGTCSGEIHFAPSLRTGFVFQDPDAQLVTETVREELAFGLENRGRSPEEIFRRVGEMAGFFGLTELLDHPTDRLSGGQKQLVNLAAALADGPELLLLDEPTAQLDPVAAAEFLSTIVRLCRTVPITVILAEHRLEEIFAQSDRVAVLENGALTADTPEMTARFLSGRAESSPIYDSLPAAVRLFSKVGGSGVCPLTVTDGRDFLTRTCAGQPSPLKNIPVKSGGEKLLCCKRAFFRYEKCAHDILKDTSITLSKGEIICLLGANGSGKSTLLQLLAGLRRPYSGKVDRQYRRLSLLMQEPLLQFSEKTLRAELEKTAAAFSAAENRLHECCERFALNALLECCPLDLSGGELQRAALAKLLLTDPEVLLLDEPTKGMDAASKNALAHLLRQLAEEGTAVLCATHDVEFAAITADRCALLFDGKVSTPLPPREFFSENYFYTTAANRMARHLCKSAVTCEDAAALCEGCSLKK